MRKKIGGGTKNPVLKTFLLVRVKGCHSSLLELDLVWNAETQNVEKNDSVNKLLSAGVGEAQ